MSTTERVQKRKWGLYQVVLLGWRDWQEDLGAGAWRILNRLQRWDRLRPAENRAEERDLGRKRAVGREGRIGGRRERRNNKVSQLSQLQTHRGGIAEGWKAQRPEPGSIHLSVKTHSPVSCFVEAGKADHVRKAALAWHEQ